MRLFRSLAPVLALAMALMIAAPAASQGRGVIVVSNGNGTEYMDSLNPVRCSQTSCARLVSLLFPTLFATDPATGLPIDATVDNYGLVSTVSAPEGDVYTLTLRGDLLWSDGTAITAYDVFYSLLAVLHSDIGSPYTGRLSTHIAAAEVVDEHTVRLLLKQPTCATPSNINFPITPYRPFAPNFAETVSEFQADWDLAETYEALLEAYPRSRFGVLLNHPFDHAPSATAGIFDFNEFRPFESVRLEADHGALAFLYADLPYNYSETDVFLAGDSNILFNPPYQDRDDIRARTDIQIAEFPANNFDFIAFNLANPNRPRGAFDWQGDPLDQEQHPLFGDVRVREAIRMGIDVDALIETALLGNGVRMTANLIPTHWAYNDTLSPIPYQPAEARQLLESIGWKDRNRDGLRECVSCDTAPENTPLQFELMVADDSLRSIASSILSQQLAEIGVGVMISSIDYSRIAAQRYDAYWDNSNQPITFDPDNFTPRITRENDVLNVPAGNVTSYFNPRVDELMAEARNLAGCDPATRAELYREVQSILYEDVPYIWLYAPTEMIAASNGVLGFNPYPQRPFWNVREWIIVP